MTLTMKSFAVGALAAVAGASELKLTWSDCGDPSTKTKITGFTPASLTLGQSATMIGTGTLSEEVSGANFDLEMTGALGTLLSCKGDASASKTCPLPLGTGHLTFDALTFPLKPGTTQVKVEIQLASQLPPSLQTTTTAASAVASNGDKLFCIQIKSSTAAVKGGNPLPLATPAEHAAWQKFKVEYLKKYPTVEEEDKRFIIFVGNLRRAGLLNDGEPHADFGVTKFSDMTTEEFRALLGYRSSDAPSEVRMAPKVQVHGALPDSIDWTQRATTPVKDQGNCGSCWAFSATEQIESDFMVQKNISVVLGVQELVDCTGSGLPRFGCLGGEPPAAYKVIQKLGGMELEKDYPYRGMMTIPICHLKKEKLAITVDDWAYVGKNDETEMKKYVGTNGPLSVCVNAGSWHSYKSGVMTNCPSKDTDHCVQVVGYGKTSDGLEYWKVRNSWGTNFGEEGFLRVALGSNQCDITSEPTKTTAGHVISAPMRVQNDVQASSIVV